MTDLKLKIKRILSASLTRYYKKYFLKKGITTRGLDSKSCKILIKVKIRIVWSFTAFTVFMVIINELKK